MALARHAGTLRSTLGLPASPDFAPRGSNKIAREDLYFTLLPAFRQNCGLVVKAVWPSRENKGNPPAGPRTRIQAFSDLAPLPGRLHIPILLAADKAKEIV